MMQLDCHPTVLGIFTHKICSKCGERKPKEFFSKSRAVRDGLAVVCRVCYKQYWVEHRDEQLEKRRGYYKRNADTFRAKQSAYYQTERGHRVSINSKANRRAAKLGGDGNVTGEDLRLIRQGQMDEAGNLVCYWCHEVILPDETPHLDHWIPLSKGGRHEVENLHYMHARCNLSKSDKLPPFRY